MSPPARTPANRASMDPSQPVPEGKVRLISMDDFVFLIDEEAARVSTTIRGMLDSQGLLVESPAFSWIRVVPVPFPLSDCINKTPRHTHTHTYTHTDVFICLRLRMRFYMSIRNYVKTSFYEFFMGSNAGEFQETQTREVKLSSISGRALEKCCEYFYYKLKYANVPSKNIPAFHVPPELALELLVASNFLDT